MDVGDDDLFAVFDSDSSKAKQVVIPQEDGTEDGFPSLAIIHKI